MKNETTTTEIMEFLQEHVSTKEDLEKALAKQKSELLSEIDDKLGNLKGDLTILMRKEDRKVVGLITLLKDKAILNNEEASKLLAMEPFPQS